MKKYILALDEGTTSARSILFDKSCSPVASAQHEFNQIYPKPGLVEHDPMEIYAAQYATMTECIAKSGVSPDEIAGIGITNQRETTVVWNARTGKPIYNAIVWQCRRTSDICEALVRDGCADMIKRKTGLRVDAYFSATKIKWILDNVDGAREAAERGELLFGTVDTWLVWKLTDARAFVTDRTNASRTMLYNLADGCWDKELLELFGIPESMLPEIKSSGEIYGCVDIMGAKVPISGICGDQQAALFGQRCFAPGSAKVTYGTGCFLLASTGERIIESRNGLITTEAASLHGEKRTFALEGSVFVGGAVVQWLRDELGLIDESRDSEYFASKVADSGGVYIVPAFAGLGAPHWDMHAKGTIVGLTRGTKREHIIRAALESIAYQTNEIIAAIQADLGEELSLIKADGGASANGLLMQFQADISAVKLVRSAQTEATAAGAAMLAGLAVGFFDSRDSIAPPAQESAFKANMSGDERKALLDGWSRAIGACKAF